MYKFILSIDFLDGKGAATIIFPDLDHAQRNAAWFERRGYKCTIEQRLNSLNK